MFEYEPTRVIDLAKTYEKTMEILCKQQDERNRLDEMYTPFKEQRDFVQDWKDQENQRKAQEKFLSILVFFTLPCRGPE